MEILVITKEGDVSKEKLEIGINHDHGTYRVRRNYGYKVWLKTLKNKKKEIESQIEDAKKKSNPSLLNFLETDLYQNQRDIDIVEEKMYTVVNAATGGKRKDLDKIPERTANFKDLEAARYALKLFDEARRQEEQGNNLSDDLKEKLESLEDIPKKVWFIEETANILAELVSYEADKIRNISYEDLIKKDKDIKKGMAIYKIDFEAVQKKAKNICLSDESIVLKNKKYLYTGAPAINAIDDWHINCLMALAEYNKVDGIILNGPWFKNREIPYHIEKDGVPHIIKRLCSRFKVYALKSNLDSMKLISRLREAGVIFINKGIEDEKNYFSKSIFSKTSLKNQTQNFKDYLPSDDQRSMRTKKNIFMYTTYPALERQISNRFVIGCGSSSLNFPNAKPNSLTLNSGIIKSEKYDDIGGFILRFDKDSNVYPMKFSYCLEDRVMVCGGRMFKSSGESEDMDLHLILADVHSLLVHQSSFASFIKFLEKNKKRVKTVTIDGDFFDNTITSHWDATNLINQKENIQKYETLFVEIKFARKLLEMILNITAPAGIKVYYKVGNHDEKSLKKMVQNSLAHFMESMLNMDVFLKLTENNITYIPCDASITIGDKITIIHGDELSRSRASQLCGRYMVSGHSHKAVIDNYGTVLPGMQDPKTANYIKFKDKGWSLGWGFVSKKRNITGHPELIVINERQYFDLTDIVPVEKSLNIDIEELKKEPCPLVAPPEHAPVVESNTDDGEDLDFFDESKNYIIA